MRVRNGMTHPMKWAAYSLGMYSIRHDDKCDNGDYDLCTRLFKGKSGEERYLTHEIISCRHRQGVLRIRIKIIMAIVWYTTHAGVDEQQLGNFTKQFLLRTMFPPGRSR